MTRRALLLALLSAPLLATSPSAAGDENARSWPARSDVRVDVEIIAGGIEIEGWDRDEVRLRAFGAGRNAVSVEAAPDWISIRAPDTAAGGLSWLGGVEVELRIQLPSGARVRAKTINGPIEVRGVRGSITAHAANGEIEVEGRPREAKLETLSSDIEVRGGAGRVEARAVSGSIEVEGVTEEVTATTMSGSIEVEGGGTLRRVDLRTFSGSIELEAALAPDVRAHLETHSGGIRVALPADTSARFDVQTLSGEIENDFGKRARSRKLRGRGRGLGRRLDFRVGDREGDGLVTIETLSGGVEIEARD